MGTEKELTTLKNIVRIGTVSSVDVENRTARVAFMDKKESDGNPLISGALKVIQNQPLITIEKWVDGDKWDYIAKYSSVDRSLGLGESYQKETPDVIENEKKIEYAGEEKLHKQTVKVYPWLPYIGQLVLCVYLANGESDGFVVGGV